MGLACRWTGGCVDIDPKINPMAWTGEVLDAFAPSADRSPFGPLANAGEICLGSHLYEYRNGGQRAFVAVKPLSFAAGNRLDVVALRSFGDRLQARPFYAAVESIGRQHNARFIVMCTQLPHIAKACQSAGFGISGAIAMKAINFQ